MVGKSRQIKQVQARQWQRRRSTRRSRWKYTCNLLRPDAYCQQAFMPMLQCSCLLFMQLWIDSGCFPGKWDPKQASLQGLQLQQRQGGGGILSKIQLLCAHILSGDCLYSPAFDSYYFGGNTRSIDMYGKIKSSFQSQCFLSAMPHSVLSGTTGIYS